MLNSSSRPRRAGRVSEKIAGRIKKQISEGRLAVGHKLPAEREMARQFKTSRVSVREAYRSLEELGLLRIRRGAEGGAFVIPFGHEPVRRSLSLALGLGQTSHEDLTEARMLIEPLIARLAALRAGPEDLAKLERILLQEEEDARRPAKDFRPTGGQFHRAVADCTRNLPLMVMMNTLADLTASSVSDLDVRVRTRHRKKNCEYHRQLFEALRRHDDAAAYTIMVRHVGDIQSRVDRVRSRCGDVARPKRAAANGRN
jgi:GntR family transcriptional regulator, transcriptional repressor for pyruvate dehydrogenase complex